MSQDKNLEKLERVKRVIRRESSYFAKHAVIQGLFWVNRIQLICRLPLLNLTICLLEQFNLKPSSGIKFLFEHNLVPKEPKAIAQFLRDSPGLDKVFDLLRQFHYIKIYAPVFQLNVKYLFFFHRCTLVSI